MIKIDEPLSSEAEVMYLANCLTCNDPTNLVLNLATTMNKYEAMIRANDHIVKYGDGHQVCITYTLVQ